MGAVVLEDVTDLDVLRDAIVLCVVHDLPTTLRPYGVTPWNHGVTEFVLRPREGLFPLRVISNS